MPGGGWGGRWWQWQGPAYTKATLCPGVGKGGEEKCDDWRSEEERGGGDREAKLGKGRLG